jgi:hypothetical protein
VFRSPLRHASAPHNRRGDPGDNSKYRRSATRNPSDCSSGAANQVAKEEHALSLLVVHRL